MEHHCDYACTPEGREAGYMPDDLVGVHKDRAVFEALLKGHVHEADYQIVGNGFIFWLVPK